MSRLSNKLKEEFFAVLPPTIFFFVALHIVAFIRVLMLKGTGISPQSSASILVAALILGKSVLLFLYCTTHELVRVMGKDKVLQIFFGPMPVPQ